VDDLPLHSAPLRVLCEAVLGAPLTPSSIELVVQPIFEAFDLDPDRSLVEAVCRSHPADGFSSTSGTASSVTGP
jgi:hypothetical protein